MAELYLAKPAIEFKTEYLDMLEDWKQSGEKLVPWVLSFETRDFSAMIAMLEGYGKGMGLQDDQVEHSTYWLVNHEKKVLGAVNIRQRLNDYLSRNGGHIGYGIRPSARGKGYATEILRLALLIAQSLGIEKALIT